MGAIQQGDFQFDVEYAVSLQEGAIHVYRDGEFIEELTFSFGGQKPDEQQIEKLVNDYVERNT
ncbi:hypothetical protein SAMN05421676_102416 [Salinibacillus kushneri]|uniref:YbxH family protein n=1 Tax=Salinibacillus kushneri TaxID=237682 RepID=A0A1I0BC02_9BACI|nr:DUF5370 family protein [Salinibacillus kushneri]SET04377.1 hypothetical protein SAMN05421676_102416 [Salinibacillus kushneri]